MQMQQNRDTIKQNLPFPSMLWEDIIDDFITLQLIFLLKIPHHMIAQNKQHNIKREGKV